ncbi:MAG: hypothetical protein WA210_00835 [Burkholderiaceae bacterium]
MADPSTALATKENEGNTLPAALGGYKIATYPPQKLVELVSANIAGGISAFDLTRIKVPAGGGITWMVPSLDGPEEAAKTIDGVIVAWSDQRAFWRESFSGAGAPPDCASRDSRIGVGDPGGPCHKCAFAQFGSAPPKPGKTDAGRGQACKQMRLLFIVRPGDLLPIVVAAPPTSLKAMRDYFIKLAGAGIPYYQAITSLKLAQDKNADGIQYSLVEPRMASQLSDDEAARIKMFSDSLQGVFKTVDLTAEDVAQA